MKAELIKGKVGKQIGKTITLSLSLPRRVSVSGFCANTYALPSESPRRETLGRRKKNLAYYKEEL